MRALTLGLLLAAPATTPALAQRIDTRTDDVTERDGEIHCRSHAHAELDFQHMPDGSGAKGAWVSSALEPEYGDRAQLGLALSPRKGAVPFDVAAEVIGIRVRDGSKLGKVDSVKLRVDGVERPTRFLIYYAAGDATTLYLTVADDGIPLAGELMNARLAELELFRDRTRLAGLSWDVKHLRDGAELLQVIHWECRQPV